MTLFVIVLAYILIGCVRTAFNLAIYALDEDADEISVSSSNIVSSILGWGICVIVLPLAETIANIMRGDM